MKPEETKESASLPPRLPSQEAAATIQDPLNVSLAAPQSLTTATSSGTDNDGAKTPINSGEKGSVSELPEMFQ